MPATSGLSRVRSPVDDPARAGLLTALADGRARTANELARHVGLAASTACEQLAQLRDAGLVTIAAQGRHRYWRLAGPYGTEALDAAGPPPAGFAYARSCYDHLAGALAVDIYDRLLRHGRLEVDGGQLRLADAGFALLESMGADTDRIRGATRVAARPCLDATERRHHLAGAAGAALLTALLDNGWLVRGPQARVLRTTELGSAQLAARLLA